MLKWNKCLVCSEDFLSWSFLYYYVICFDKNINLWLDYGLEVDEIIER